MKNLFVYIKCAVLLVALIIFSGCSEEREKYTVVEEQIVESVYSSVVIEPQMIYKVNASNVGYLDELNVATGDTVDVGQLLFSIRDIQSANNANNARLAYEMARNNYQGDANLLEDLKLELKDAQLKLTNDSVNFKHNEELYKNGLVTKFERDQSEMVYEASQSRLRLINNRISRSESDLKTTLSQAKNNLNSSMSRFEDGIIRSRLSGIVYEIFKEPGELVSMQEPVAIIGSQDKFVINMRIDEVDITRVKIGQKIVVAMEAYRDQSFEAKVTRISPRMDTQTQTFVVEGEFIEKPEALFMGLTGEGNIVVSEKDKALVIPREYLIGGTQVETSVGMITVRTGAKSLSHVEIISGLKAGDVIIKPF